jgi:hypothetical protein
MSKSKGARITKTRAVAKVRAVGTNHALQRNLAHVDVPRPAATSCRRNHRRHQSLFVIGEITRQKSEEIRGASNLTAGTAS